MNATQTADPVRNDVLRAAARWIERIRDAKLAAYRTAEGRGRGPADRERANRLFTDVAELDDLVRKLQKQLG